MPFSPVTNIDDSTLFSEYPTKLQTYLGELQSYVNNLIVGDLVFNDDLFVLSDGTDPAKKAKFELAGITTGATRTYTLPNANCVLATTSTVTQTFSGTTTFSGTWTASGTTATLGSGTGAITANVGTGATTNGTTKTVNVGTNGVSGSTTNINLGSAVLGSVTNLLFKDGGLDTRLYGEMFYSLSASRALVDQTTAQDILGVGIDLIAGNTYLVEGMFTITKTAGTTSMAPSLQLLAENGLVGSAIAIQVTSRFGGTLTAVEPVDQYGFISALNTALALQAANASASVGVQVWFKGVLDVTTAGRLTPALTQSAVSGGAYTVGAGSWMSVRKLGSAGANSVQGTWA